MSHVFISYCRKDKRRVDRLVDDLRFAGLDVWLDRRDLGIGRWRPAIVEAIRTSEHLLVVLTPRANQSDNVRREIDIALERKVPIVPVMLISTQISPEMALQLTGEQIFDLSVNYRDELRKLMAALGAPEPVQRQIRKRKRDRSILWLVGGAATGLLGGTTLLWGNSAAAGLAHPSLLLLACTALGLVTGLLAGMLLTLLGWVARLVIWLSVAFAGCAGGASVSGLVALDSDTTNIATFLGMLAALLLAMALKRWRSARRQRRLASLAGV